MTSATANATARPRRRDGWRTHRIWICGASGLWLGAAGWILDFWPLGGGVVQTLRTVVDLSRILIVLGLAVFVVVMAIAALVALFRLHLTRAASSVVAVAALPLCYLFVAHVPLFDPWLWYTVANKSRFEALAASPPAGGPKFAVLSEEDVSSGFAGIDPNHFVLLVYDESGAVGLAPSDRPAVWGTRLVPVLNAPFPQGRRLNGHIFRVDCYD